MVERVSQEFLARRVAAELKPGQVVNLGAGLPALVPRFTPPDPGVVFHSENGVLGYGPVSVQGMGDPDLVDAGGSPITPLRGAAIVDQADSLGIIRGGYVDMAVVEPLQVSPLGDLADRWTAEERFDGTSTALEVATRAKYVVAMMEHTTQDGAPRLLSECTLPVAAPACVGLIVTDVAVIRVAEKGLVLEEIAPGWKVEEVQAITGARLVRAPDLKEMQFSQPWGRPVDKTYRTAAEAVADIPDGAVLMLDGFAGPGGMAQYLILALRDRGAKNLTIISNTAGIARVTSFGTPPGFVPIDHSLLVDNGQVGKAVASFPVSPSPIPAQLLRARLQAGRSRAGACTSGHSGGGVSGPVDTGSGPSTLLREPEPG